MPDFLAERLLAVVDRPELYPEAEAEILTLLDMLPDYDTYGQTGHIGMGVSNGILEEALRRLEGQRKNRAHWKITLALLKRLCYCSTTKQVCVDFLLPLV